MRLDEAYMRWGSESQNRELYKKTKDVFRKATWRLPTNQPCAYYTLPVLARAFAAANLATSDKSKAASVMVHVLNYAHNVDPDNNPNPGFSFSDITDYAGSDTATKQEEPATESPVDIPQEAVKPEEKPEPAEEEEPGQEEQTVKEVVQLDPKTLKEVRTWKSAGTAEKILGIKNILRAVDRHGLAGGFFWCRPGEVKGFSPGSSRIEKAKPRAKVARPKAEVKPEPVPEPVVEDVMPVPNLMSATDEELVDEIRRRRWKGQLTITKVVDFI